MEPKSRQSRKAAIVFMGLTALARCEDWRLMVCILLLAAIGIGAQAVLDWKEKGPTGKAEGE